MDAGAADDSTVASARTEVAADAEIWRTPPTWRVLLVAARILSVPVCRLRVSGELSPALRAGPAILAANHIGPFDPVAITAACQVGASHPG